MSRLQKRYHSLRGIMNDSTWIIGWDLQFGEFTLWDHYYFSRLQALLDTQTRQVVPVKDPKIIESLDVLVLNYPEKPLPESFIRFLYQRMEIGLRIIALSYYQDEDQTASILNHLTEPLGIRFNRDGVIDPVSCADADPFYVRTPLIEIYSNRVREVVFPCSCSLTLLSPGVRPVVQTLSTAVSVSPEQKQTGSWVLAAERRMGKGSLLAIGTCVFWDNYSIDRADNRNFVLNILQPEDFRLRDNREIG